MDFVQLGEFFNTVIMNIIKMNDEKPKILCLPNGPYYLLNDRKMHVVDNLQNSKGEKLSNIHGIALCRCGGSKNKPFCDGTHGINGFKSEKLTDGSKNKRERYACEKVTVNDNRGICAHSGVCTNNLAKVFRSKTEPWIDADGATVEEIIKTVKQCPSGALSYSIDDVEYKDQDREPMLTVSKDGPYHITGGIELIDESFGAGASKEHYTLCRCGGSKNKPFCDGTHWYIKFKDEKN